MHPIISNPSVQIDLSLERRNETSIPQPEKDLSHASSAPFKSSSVGSSGFSTFAIQYWRRHSRYCTRNCLIPPSMLVYVSLRVLLSYRLANLKAGGEGGARPGGPGRASAGGASGSSCSARYSWAASSRRLLRLLVEGVSGSGMIYEWGVCRFCVIVSSDTGTQERVEVILLEEVEHSSADKYSWPLSIDQHYCDQQYSHES